MRPVIASQLPSSKCRSAAFSVTRLMEAKSFLLSSYGFRARHDAEWHPSGVIPCAPTGSPWVPVGRAAQLDAGLARRVNDLARGGELAVARATTLAPCWSSM